MGLVESQDLVARRDREGRIPRDLQGTWDWTVRHGKVSTGGWNPYLKEALQTMFETGLPAIVSARRRVRERWGCPVSTMT